MILAYTCAIYYAHTALVISLSAQWNYRMIKEVLFGKAQIKIITVAMPKACLTFIDHTNGSKYNCLQHVYIQESCFASTVKRGN